MFARLISIARFREFQSRLGALGLDLFFFFRFLKCLVYKVDMTMKRFIIGITGITSLAKSASEYPTRPESLPPLRYSIPRLIVPFTYAIILFTAR